MTSPPVAFASSETCGSGTMACGRWREFNRLKQGLVRTIQILSRKTQGGCGIKGSSEVCSK